MKLTLCLGLLACIIGCISCCNVASECTITCSAGQHMACINHKCECHGDHELDCTDKSQCGNLNCDKYHSAHCVDAHCKCQFEWHHGNN
ncbi:Hypothetical predicted protein [Mytilus galloprovincialis]|uniref:Uncharacterized protein n=2 Tax=Mytilus galloprovincialis TaxID=29158 RepID=A0A8B6D2S0_MYTGA|nr:Hypothetical predicted protein [Mytilus galloprovincialis]